MTADLAAIAALREHEPPEGYYVCFSGGKDSTVILDLVKRAGVKYEAWHNIMTIEPPELMRFIYRNFPEVHHVHSARTMYQLILEYGCPPLRWLRYCCWRLKTVNGNGRLKVDGVRAAESPRRAKRQILEPDNHGGFYLHLIRDWTDEQIWDYIRARNLPYCELYDQGKRRIGCVFCPFATPAENAENVKRYPGFVKYFVTACDRAIKIRRAKGKHSKYETGREMFEAWLTGKKGEKPVKEISSITGRIKTLAKEIAALDAVADKIDRLKAQKAIELGRLLVEVKAALPHGQFKSWVAQNFALGYRSAANFMAVASLANVQPVSLFGYSQLLQLLPLGADLPAFLRDNPAAADLSKRALRDAVAHWRAKTALPAADTITMDAVITSTEIIETPRFLQPALFPLEPVPAARNFNFHLPRDVIAAAHKIPAPCSLIRRRADFDFAFEGVVVAFAGISDLPLILARASALIPLPVRLTFTDGDCARRRNCLILFTGDNIHAFAAAFKPFGSVTVPLKRKNPAAPTAGLNE